MRIYRLKGGRKAMCEAVEKYAESKKSNGVYEMDFGTGYDSYADIG